MTCARFVAAAAVLIVVTAACARSQPDEEQTRPAIRAQAQPGGSRLFEASRWDTAYVIGGQLQDTTLLLPRLIAAGDGSVYVYDVGRHELVAFDVSGAQRWRFGREGAGPGEFRNPIDVKVAHDGSVWVLDGGLGRVTIVESTGNERASFLLSGLFISAIAPLREATVGTVLSSADEFWVEFDSAGRVVRRGRTPVAALEQVSQLARQAKVAVAPDGQGWAVVFPFGNVLLVFRGHELLCQGSLIEGDPFPGDDVPVAAMPVWAISAALSDTSVFVLARGASDDALQILDEYSRDTCAYRRTLRLPQKARAMSLRGGLFHIAYEDPAPTLIGLRRVEEH